MVFPYASSSGRLRKTSSCTKISVISVESTPRGCHERLSMTSSLSEVSVDMILGIRPHVEAHWIWMQRNVILFASMFSCQYKINELS